MDLSNRLSISYYKTIAVINEDHKIYLVQHQETNKIFVKKNLDIYNQGVYEFLHRNPVIGTPRIVDFYRDQNQLIVIEEYISGTSLQEIMSSRPLFFQDVLTYMMDLCSILKSLHSVNPPIIHRDIKPSNIIITPYNRAVLLDFNAAKYYSSQSQKDTILLGTQGYAAPEQYGFGASSPQTDIYSLGVILREMVAHNQELSYRFSSIIERCLMMNPAQRYHNVDELQHAIMSVSHGDVSVNSNMPMSINNPASVSSTTGGNIPVNANGSTISTSPRRFFLPGFRTLTPWKILVAIPVYLFALWLSLTLEVEESTGWFLWYERILTLLMFFSVVAGCCNYLDIQRFMPLCKSSNKYLHYLGILLLVCIMEFFLFAILVIVGVTVMA